MKDETKVEELLRRYCEIDSEHKSWGVREGAGRHPGWAYEFPAPVPFVGNRYATSSPRLLVYASAENINNKRDEYVWFNDPALMRNRHRISKDHRGTRVGIRPFDAGGLQLAAALLWHWSGAALPSDGFIEHVAVANLSKFTIKPGAPGADNIDAGDGEVRESLQFILADLGILRPSLVLLAKPIGLSVAVPIAQHAQSVGALVVPMYQCNGQSFGTCATQLVREAPSGYDESSLVATDVERVRSSLGIIGASSPGYLAYFRLLRLRFRRAVQFGSGRQQGQGGARGSRS